MQARKQLGSLLLLLLLAGGITKLALSPSPPPSLPNSSAQVAQTTLVRGLIGSEKSGYFADPRVQARLQQNGLRLQLDKAGSRQMATSNLKNYDFAFPSGAPAAQKLQQLNPNTQAIPIFYTPMVIASWKALLAPLQHAGLVQERAGVYYLTHFAGLLQLIEHGSRWRDLANNPEFAVGKSILVATTDIRTSNSAAMYLALASYVLNKDNVVQSEADITQIIPQLAPLFSKQGYQESSSAGPFEDYTLMGIGKAPLVMIYESQFIEYRLRNPQANPDMRLLYPEPTLYSKHLLIPLSESGRQLAQLLLNDPELRQVAIEYGLRSNDNAAFQARMQQAGLTLPSELYEVVEPPAYEVLERLIQALEQPLR